MKLKCCKPFMTGCYERPLKTQQYPPQNGQPVCLRPLIVHSNKGNGFSFASPKTVMYSGFSVALSRCGTSTHQKQTLPGNPLTLCCLLPPFASPSCHLSLPSLLALPCSVDTEDTLLLLQHLIATSFTYTATAAACKFSGGDGPAQPDIHGIR